MDEQLKELLDRGLDSMAKAGLPAVEPGTRGQLLLYIDLLKKWNRVYNLTAVREPAQMVSRHLLDSLVLRPWLPEPRFPSEPDATVVDVLDIGSGAGLPVLPLAIVHPELSFISVESNGKKSRFQQQAVLELKLGNVHVLNSRVEEVAARARFVTSRAFTAPVDFLRIAEPLCARNGVIAIMLGLAERLPAVMPAHFFLDELVEVTIPYTESTRHIALCRRSGPI